MSSNEQPTEQQPSIDQQENIVQSTEAKAEGEEEYTNLIQSLPTRWEIELEFVQSLSNIPYLQYLAQNNYLSDPNFINYLKYLTYWQKPEYAKFLVYPNCLHILEMLQNESFRLNIVNPEFLNTLMNDMVKRWQENDGEVDGTATIKNATPLNLEGVNSLSLGSN